MEIKCRFTGKVLFSFQTDSLKVCVEIAVKSGADLSGADLSRADLSWADLSRANLSVANLYGANLSRANLSRANLSGAYLSRADLSGADLSGANLSVANLYGANLSRADLSRADLSRASLSGANLSWADLSRANLSGADLSRAEYGDGVPMENIPLQLQGTNYNILVMDTHIKIGYKLYKHTEWESFTDDEISRMDSGALAWWDEWKGLVLSLSLGHQKRIAKK